MLIGRRDDGTGGGLHLSDAALLGLALLAIVGEKLGKELGELEGPAEAKAEGRGWQGKKGYSGRYGSQTKGKLVQKRK